MIVGFIKKIEGYEIECRIIKFYQDDNLILYRDFRMGTSEPDVEISATELLNNIRSGTWEAIHG